MRKLTFGFIGIGLIGGSIAKAIRRVLPESTIIVYNRRESSRTLALNDGTANIATDKVDSTFSQCGLEEHFIGGHPMAGSEKTGYENANDRLVENAYYPLTPTNKVEQKYVDELTKIVKMIGAIPIRISYEEHDKVVAAISHLPHLIAASLVNLVKHNDSKEEYMKTLAAGGFKDIMWEQICMTNTKNISIMLDKYIHDLKDIKSSLDNKRGSDINALITESRDYRDNIEEHNNSIIPRSYRIYCNIIDESGAIATIATILATSGVSIKNIGIVHNREFEDGVLKISFYDQDSADRAVEMLERHKYDIVKRQ